MPIVNAQVRAEWNTLSDEQVVRQVIDGQTALLELLMRRNPARWRVRHSAPLDENLGEMETLMMEASTG